MFVDTHAHIPFEKSESFVKNAKEANLNIIVFSIEVLITIMRVLEYIQNTRKI